MQRLAATLEDKGREGGGENGRGFPLQRDGESLKGGRNLFATRSNDRSACWNSEYLCRLFFFFFFLAAENSYGSTFFVAKYCIKIQYFGIDSMIFIEEKINSFIVQVCREL